MIPYLGGEIFSWKEIQKWAINKSGSDSSKDIVIGPVELSTLYNYPPILLLMRFEGSYSNSGGHWLAFVIRNKRTRFVATGNLGGQILWTRGFSDESGGFAYYYPVHYGIETSMCGGLVSNITIGSAQDVNNKYTWSVNGTFTLYGLI